jgi:hypothetical protein
MMKGMAYFAPYSRERRGTERRADPKPERVLINIARNMTRKAISSVAIIAVPLQPI